jgi:hypothetical protein
VVLIDDEHRNDVDREDVGALVDAVVQGGYEVEFYRGDRSLAEALNGSEAFVVVDPKEEFAADEVDTVEQFVENGGHLAIVGEPNVRQIQLTLRGAQITTERSSVTTIASAFGVSFGTNYVYDQAENDGNFRSIVGEPSPPLDGADQLTLYTATSVHGDDLTPLVRTRSSAQRSDSTETRSYTVAGRAGNVVAVGDSDFMTDDRYTVADNEVFVSYLGEFLVAGDFEPPPNFTDVDESGSDDSGNGNTTNPE